VQPHADGVLLQLGGQPASSAVAALVGAGLAVDRVMPHRRLEDAFLALIAGGAAGSGSVADGPAGSDPAGSDPAGSDPAGSGPDRAVPEPERTP
jgi:hypothetical protein